LFLDRDNVGNLNAIKLKNGSFYPVIELPCFTFFGHSKSEKVRHHNEPLSEFLQVVLIWAIPVKGGGK